MAKKSLESFIENSWNFAKKVIGSSTAKKVATIVVGGIAYFGWGTEAKAQLSTPIDSISVSAEYGPENRGPQAFRESIWELKDGVPQVRKTIDLGIIKIDGPPWNLPGLVYGSGFGVKYQSSEWDTILVKFKVYRYPENTPIEGAAANIFNAYGGLSNPDIDGIHLGVSGNYLDPSSNLITNEKGEAQMRLRIKVRKAPESIDSVVTVLFPNNGEQLLGASEQEISWENNYSGDNFKVSFSTDNGNTWEYIANGTEFKNGSSSVMKYDWKIPNDITSDSCLVKVEDDKNSKVYDISDKVFSVDIDTYVESTLLDGGVPKKFSVSQNYPNPFNPSTKIQYQLAKSAENVKITIYDALCRKVEEFDEGSKGPGIYESTWKPRKDVSSGIYFFKVKADGKSAIKKMILQK